MALSEKQIKDLKEFLKENLRINIASGGFTDPNQRVVEVKLGKEVICRDSFSVVQTREYEG